MLRLTNRRLCSQLTQLYGLQVAKLTGRLFVNSQLDSVSFLETVVAAMREHKLAEQLQNPEFKA